MYLKATKTELTPEGILIRECEVNDRKAVMNEELLELYTNVQIDIRPYLKFKRLNLRFIKLIANDFDCTAFLRSEV